MSMTVQIHPDRFSTVLFDDQPDPFVIVRAAEDGAGVSLFLGSAALCDELIAAAAAAKRLLLAAQQAAPGGELDGGASGE